MKKMNRKGFTIVELVIVIAVIAILAGVLIPTFSGIVTKAQVSAEQQKITNAYKEAYANELLEKNGIIADGGTETVNGVKFNFAVDNDGKLTASIESGNNTTDFKYEYKQATNTWVVSEN